VTDEMDYSEFVQAHNLPPLVPVKRACEIANVGHTKFYELVEAGDPERQPTQRHRETAAPSLFDARRQGFFGGLVAPNAKRPTEGAAGRFIIFRAWQP
jgi:hypothetical protein